MHEKQHEEQHEEQQLKTVKPHKSSATRLILSLFLTTLFLALSWQSDATAFFVFFAFVPVFFLLNDRVPVVRDKPLLLILTFLSMFLVSYAGVYWIRNVDPATHLVIAFLRGVTMFLPFLAAYLFIFSGKPAGTITPPGTNDSPGQKHSSDNASRPGDSDTNLSNANPDFISTSDGTGSSSPIIIFIAAWMIMEVLHDLNIFGLSYGNLGHILAAYPGAIQWYAVAGNLGGTLWILLVNYALFLLLVRLLPGQIRLVIPSTNHSTTNQPNAESISKEGSSTSEIGNARQTGTDQIGSEKQSRTKNRSLKSGGLFIPKRAMVLSNLAVLPLLVSFIMYRAPSHTTPTYINVIALHTSMDVYDYKYETDPETLLNTYITSTKPYLNPATPNIIFWPENALTGGLFIDSLVQSATVKKIRKELLAAVPGPSLVLVTGAIIDQVTPPAAPGTYDPRILFQEAQNYHFKRYNTALFISSDGQPQVKKKKRLVPMSEIVPKQKIFAPLVRLVPNLEDMNFSPADNGYEYFEIGRSSVNASANLPSPSHRRPKPGAETSGRRVTRKGTDPQDQDAKKIRTSPIICYGSAFSTFTADEVKNTQSDFLAILLNEGWMQSNVAYRHFNWFAICRAIENRRFVVKSSNEGITTLIDSKGKMGRFMSGKTGGAVTGNLRVNEKMTFYTKHHGWIVPGLLILAMILMLAQFIRRRR